MPVLAIDPGFGTTKVAYGSSHIVTVQSVAGVGSHKVGQLKFGRLAQVDRVVFDGVSYLVGNNVPLYTQPLQSMSVERLQDSPASRAVFYAAIGKLFGAGQHTVSKPIIGLPVNLLRDQPQARKTYRALSKWLIGGHDFDLNGTHTTLLIENGLMIVPQPVGSYYSWCLDKNLASRIPDDWYDNLVMIVDVGKNTLDILTTRAEKMVPRWTVGASLGTRVATQVLMKKFSGMDEPTADRLLRTRRPVWAGKPIDDLVDQALSLCASRIIDYIERECEGALFEASPILITGGGALLLRQRLLNQYPAAIIVDNPVTANVEGLELFRRVVGDDA